MGIYRIRVIEEYKMKKTHTLAGLVLGTALLGAGLTSAFAADETLRSLAEKNNIYIGAILNSQWFSGGLPGNYEQIHKQHFNIVGQLCAVCATKAAEARRRNEPAEAESEPAETRPHRRRRTAAAEA